MATLSLPRPLELSGSEDYQILPRSVEIAGKKYVIVKERGEPGTVYRQVGDVVDYQVQVDSPKKEEQDSVITALSDMGFGSDFEPFIPVRYNPTIREEDVLRFMQEYTKRELRGPTAQEIREKFSLSETSTYTLMRRLNSEGLTSRRRIGFGRSCLTIYEMKKPEPL